jgi:hypothetical protein
MKQIYNNAQHIMYMNSSKKTLKGEELHKPRGTVQIESTQIKWFLRQPDGRLGLVRGIQRHSTLS